MAHSKKGNQIALFSDQHVRRDYLKSKQWVDQHMRIKVHLSGMAVAYENGAHPKKAERPPLPGRAQGSLVNQQKHAIADAIEWIRQNSKFKPRIFVATSPGFIEHAKEGRYIQKLAHNLRNGYGMANYVWVRELTRNGYPHFHFVADVDEFDPVHLSRYWSGLFCADSRNSIRCGTAPFCPKCKAKLRRRGDTCQECNRRAVVNYWVNSPRMCYYMTKYLGKSVGTFEKGERKQFRTFGISQEARKASEPLIYQGKVFENYNGHHQRTFFLQDDQIEEGLPLQVNPLDYGWRWTGHANTYIGFPRKK